MSFLAPSKHFTYTIIPSNGEIYCKAKGIVEDQTRRHKLLLGAYIFKNEEYERISRKEKGEGDKAKGQEQKTWGNGRRERKNEGKEEKREEAGEGREGGVDERLKHSQGFTVFLMWSLFNFSVKNSVSLLRYPLVQPNDTTSYLQNRNQTCLTGSHINSLTTFCL